MATYSTVEIAQVNTGMGLGAKAMLWNIGLSGALFVFGYIYAATAPSLADDPACNNPNVYRPCFMGDPQAIQGALYCAAAVGLFVLISLLIGLVVLAHSVGKRASA